MIDPDTTVLSSRRIHDGKELVLTMSDEFNEAGRSFKSGQDQYFTAIHQPGMTNEEIQFYDSSYVTTENGYLTLKTSAEKTTWTEYDDNLQQDRVMTRNYTSSMLQSWNQFCFTGGALEMSIQLPGGKSENIAGLWPAAWMMGNLARADFPTSTKSVWPWSYDACDGTIPDLESRQEINACLASPGHGLNSFQGRGSPEIDLFEVNSISMKQPRNFKSNEAAFMSSSLQISPAIQKPYRPVNGHFLNSSFIWYDNIRLSEGGEYNAGFWGQECAAKDDNTIDEEFKYWEDAVSANFDLNDSFFQTPHTYRLEWQPGENGYLEWYVDGNFMMGIDAQSLANVTGSMIPVEPMYLVFNVAVSQSWGFPQPCDKTVCNSCYSCFDCTNPDCQCSLPDSMMNCGNLPADMKIDYIRLYQDSDDSTHTLSCSPEKYPTRQFIIDHAERYQDWKPKSSPFSPPEVPPTPMIVTEYDKEMMLACVLALFLCTIAVSALRTKGSFHQLRYLRASSSIISQQEEESSTSALPTPTGTVVAVDETTPLISSSIPKKASPYVV